jgi:hypothetical protein
MQAALISTNSRLEMSENQRKMFKKQAVQFSKLSAHHQESKQSLKKEAKKRGVKNTLLLAHPLSLNELMNRGISNISGERSKLEG